jgi:predicted ATP-binding protein involved in virulence
MFINSIHIEKYKIFEDLKIDFQIPENSKMENGNIVNVIAGVNGSGKTTLLEWIYFYLGGQIKIISINGNNRTIDTNLKKTGSLKMNNEEILSKENYINFAGKIIDNKFSNEEKVVFFDSTTISKDKTIFLEQNNQNDDRFLNYIDSKIILNISEEYIKNYILFETFNSRESDPKKRMKSVVNQFNKTFEKTKLLSKLDGVNENFKPIFKSNNRNIITLENLSSGEKQLYGRVITLKKLNPKNSIILIDEPELSLHPQWQTEIMKIYSNIGENNQFIVTTHSPFIISQTHHKNLIFLTKENEKIVAKQFNENENPPHRDINTLLKTLMGAEYLPKELEKLQNEYRELFDKNMENTPKCEELKKRILEWESPNSSFWQGIDFDRELRDI